MKTFNLHTHHNSKDSIVNGYLKGPVETMGWKSLGIHPWYITDDWERILIEFELQVKQNTNILALGECGLDKLCSSVWEQQLEVFEAQVNLAKRLNKPIIVHSVKAYNECESLLKRKNVAAVFHGFNRKVGLLEQLMKNEQFYFSFGQSVFKPSVEQTIRCCPLEKMFLETDNLAIEIEAVYEKVALIKGVTLKKVEKQLLLNRKTVFGI